MGLVSTTLRKKRMAGQWMPAFDDRHSAENNCKIDHGDQFCSGGDRNWELFEISVDTVTASEEINGNMLLTAPRILRPGTVELETVYDEF